MKAAAPAAEIVSEPAEIILLTPAESAAQESGRERATFWERATEPAMFLVAFLQLLVIAGWIHRTDPEKGIPELEFWLMSIVSALLWPAFIVEGVVAFLRRSPNVSRGKALARILSVWIFPPLRLGWIHPTTNLIWLPRLGRQAAGKALSERLNKAFSTPMLVFAFLILPVLALEMYKPEWTTHVPYFQFMLDAAVSTIWVAFAVEFIIRASAAPNTLRYCKERWIDLAIVALPTLEFILNNWVNSAPLARLFRMGRVVSPEQFRAMTKIYRLRGLMMKGWQSFLLLEGISRLIGNTPEKQLRKLEDQIESLQEELRDLEEQANQLRQQLAAAELAAPGMPRASQAKD
jgi:ribosomal protein L29